MTSAVSRWKQYVILIITANLVPAITAVKTCYWPNGTVPTLRSQMRLQYNITDIQSGAIATSYIPCNPSDNDSMCCLGSGAHACLSNGLCFFTSDLSVDRGACTDQSWKSEKCVGTCKFGMFVLCSSAVLSSSSPSISNHPIFDKGQGLTTGLSSSQRWPCRHNAVSQRHLPQHK
jgi:hypothetical protein